MASSFDSSRLPKSSGADLTEVLRTKKLLVCVGSGGVGKTTIAATLALLGALLGRKTLVLTIDPARRLADSLGLDSLGHDIQQVRGEKLLAMAALREQTMPPQGTLFAMMLDQKRAFDEIVAKYAREPESQKRILNNPIYKQISASLAGSHEYAAISKVYDISKSDAYDLIVLDTPPTENAIDFLDAPQKVSDAIDSPAIQWFIKPYLAAGKFSMQLVGLGGSFVLKRLARFVGSEFLEQMAQFFVEFNQVLGGFRERARGVQELLRQKDVGFVLVCSPDPLSTNEALYFHDRLHAAQMPISGMVVNRVHPASSQGVGRQELVDILTSMQALRGFAPEDIVQVAADLDRTYKEQQVLAQVDEKQIHRLSLEAGRSGATLLSIPLFECDIFGVEGLALVSKHLVL